MGPQHPMTHGLWNLRIKVNGETITDAVPELGYLHRSVEKIGERRKYFMNTTLTDRLCYASAMTWTHCYCLAAEELMGVEAPLRAKYIRTVVLELQRIASHLMWLGAYLPDLGLITGFLYGMRDREMFLNLLEIPSGGRLLYNYVKIGGVKRDLPPGFEAKAERVMQTLERRLKEYENLYDNSKIFRMRNDGVGVYSASDAINWGITGPNLRSAGVPFDLRQADSYDAYPELDFEPVTNTAAGGGSDCFSRYRQRVDEMHQSMDLVRQALAKMPEGKVMADSVPLRASGEAFRRTEDSRGEALMYLVGDGSDRPYRWKIRSPMFTTVSAAPHFLKGYKVADVPAIMGSIDMCIGETDK
ncbi:MAG: NADH-quinone oxidoreductase subunit NuoD [Candidatus Poseidoniia archaeon]|nr:NADH-quinone oxidoreductase subunit NuoD [Candidatus Poseidoniia archaeon]MDP7607646.1 NADH-quinone oxidoreductase subunit NuoD [Candidatus Poseidoniia archaeon]HJP43943.1 NADH-quinone oxidoreductase subunit NuoD [Candidatus Poseidoniia archaeon]